MPIAESQAIANRISELLDRHGIGKRQQATEVQRILGLSYSQAHRKMKGENPWTIIQIKAVAEAFGESPSALVENLSGADVSIGKGVPHDALMCIETKNYSCLAWIGAEILDANLPDFVAIKLREQWRVYDGSCVPHGRRYAVELIELRPRQALAKPTIAVVDDERDLADTMCEYLSEHGFSAMPYYDERTFREALRKQAFDGFVVDWILGVATAESAIAEIRKMDNPNAPIFLLTGKLQTGEADENDVARVIRQFDVNPFEKPVRLPWLNAELSRRLAFV